MTSSLIIYAANRLRAPTGRAALIAALAAAVFGFLSTRADAEQRNWALLIGVGKYLDEKNWEDLPFTENDVRDLEDVLTTRGNYRGPKGSRVTTLYNMDRDAMWSGIQDFFAQPDKGDLVFVYYTGHGWKDSQTSRLYLVPTNFNVKDAAGTGIAIEDLRRQLDECKATYKVIVVDSCYAGTKIETEERNLLAALGITSAVNDLPAVFSLASSREKQVSYEMPEGMPGFTAGERHSLFSYWLIQALKGQADWDLNGNVDIDEAFKFVDQRIRATFQAFGDRRGTDAGVAKDEQVNESENAWQTPVRNYGSSHFVDSVPVLSVVEPQDKSVVFDDLARQIEWAVKMQGLGPIAVHSEFIKKRIGLSGIRSQSPDDAGFGKYAARQLYEHFEPEAIDEEKFREILDTIYGRQEPIRQLTQKGPKKPNSRIDEDKVVLVEGEIVRQQGNEVVLRATAYRVAAGTDVPVGLAIGRARLDSNDYPMLGKSIKVEDTDFDPLPSPTGDDLTPEESAPEYWDSEDRLRSHPLQDRSYPYRVSIEVNDGPENGPPRWKLRHPRFVDNKAYVELNPGERYGIRVGYRGKEMRRVKILVDGLSIFDQQPPGKLAELNDEQLNAQLQTKSVRLDVQKSFLPKSLSNASAWPVLGNVTAGPYEGFYIRRKVVCPFEVVDAEESWAAELGSTDLVGTITAVFYADLGKSIVLGDVGTRGGVPRRAELREITVGPLGRFPLSLFTIRYVSGDVFRRIPTNN